MVKKILPTPGLLDLITSLGNLTFYQKAMVWREKNVEMLYNIKSEKYLGGRNCKFVCNPKDLNSQSRERPSLISTVVPITEYDFQRAMSITGILPIPDYNETIDGRQKLHYSSAPYYEEVYHFTH